MTVPPSPPSPLNWLELKVPPPLVALVVAALMAWLAPHSQALETSSTLRGILAGLLVLAGGALDVSALLAFRRQRTTVNPLSPEKTAALVRTGVYRISRNPMYLGMCLFLLAWAVWLAALGAVLGPWLFVLYISRFQIQPEERVLSQHFGSAYTDYQSQVRRWL
jgi:protein-S-isoprenylcysteine O-methyltransferase Ste14